MTIREAADLTKDEILSLKRLSGQLNWVASQTRPDLSFDVCSISNTGKSPKVKLMKDANKALKRGKANKLALIYPPLGDPKNFRIFVFSDATYASLGDGASQGAFIVFLQGANGLIAPICWQSKKLHRVTKSPLASETLAVGEAADAGYLVACMILEIFKLRSHPVINCCTDNKSLFETVESTTIPSDRRLRIDLSRII